MENEIPYTTTYASMDYIDSFCKDMGLKEWSTLSTDNRQSAMFRAMDYIETYNYKGQKTVSSQLVKWPRKGATDEDGYPVSSTMIPDRVKKAFSKASYEEGNLPGCLQPNISPDNYLTFKKIDVLSWGYHPGGMGFVRIYKAITAYLQPYLIGNNRVVRT